MNSNELYEVIRQMIRDEMAVSNPVMFATGVVTSTNPLKIRTDQKTILFESMIRLPRSCTDYALDVEIPGVTDSGGDTYSGTINLTVKNALTVGESVLLIREQGGQKYTVIDRIGSDTN